MLCLPVALYFLYCKTLQSTTKTEVFTSFTMSHFSREKSLAFPPLVGRSHRETQQSSGSAQLIFKTVRLSSILLLLIHNEPFGSSGHTFAPQSWTRQEGPLYQAGGSMKELPCHVWVSGWLVIEVGPFTILSLERPLHGSLGMCSKNFLWKSKSSTSTTSHWPYALENMYQLLYHHFCGNNYIPKDCVLEERGPNPSVGPIGSMFGFNKSCWILVRFQMSSRMHHFKKCSQPTDLELHRLQTVLTSKVDNPIHMVSSSNNHTALRIYAYLDPQKGCQIDGKGCY